MLESSFWKRQGDCSVYGGWRDQLEVRLGHRFRPSRADDCSYKTSFTTSVPPGFWHDRRRRYWSCPTSCRHCRLLVPKREAAQIISGGLRLAACREKGAAVGLEQANPGLDVARMAQFAIE
jgi:hypothetical protein